MEGDYFRRCIVAGREEMTPGASAEALRQLTLRYRLAADAADTYFDQGFAVVLEDVVGGDLLTGWRPMVRSRPSHLFVLMPSRHVIAAREAQRETRGYGLWTIDALYELFEAHTPRLGTWLNTSEQTPDETVAQIFAQVGDAGLAPHDHPQEDR